MAKVQAAQLLARGVQDAWLSGQPQVSFYRSSFKRHTPFATSIERFLVPLDGKIVLNPKSDLLGYTYLTAQDPVTGALVPNADWSNIISTVELVIGNQTITTHDLTYVNTIQSVFEADTYSKRAGTPGFQPLGFFMDSRFLPIAALKYTDVRINIAWTSTAASSQYIYRCWAHCVHLGEDERRFFASQRHQMLIPQLQCLPVSREPFFRGPLKYIAAPCVNYTSLYYPKVSTAGKAQWATRLVGTGDDYGYSIATDSSGNVYVTGYYGFDSSLIVYNSDGSTFGTLENSGFNDVFVVKYNTSGTAQWATRLGGIGFDGGYGIATDSSGNVYVTGANGSNPLTVYNSDTSTFGTLANSGIYDVFVVKYNTSGTAQWVTRLAGTASDYGRSIATDSSGNVYVTGSYGSNPLYVYNSDTSTFGTLANSGSNDVFVVKYNTSGTAQWATRLAGAGNDIGYGIATDSSGNVYVTGLYGSNPLTVYNWDTSTFGTLANSGPTDVFVVKYNTSGTAQWATRLTGSGASSVGNAIAVDSSGNVYVTGYYGNNPLTVYNSNGSTFGTLTNSGILSSFVVKYNTSGTAQWATRLVGTGVDIGYGIATDSSGNVYISGGYDSNPLTVYNSDTSTFGTLANAGNTDVFVVKYNTSGTTQWATRLGGTLDDYGRSIAADSSGNVYVTGYYRSDSLTVYNSDGTTFGTLANSGFNDVFVVKYSP